MKKWLIASLIVCVAGAIHAKPVTKEDYIAKRKKQAEQQGKDFDEKKSGAYFDRFDLNNDGVLDDEEKEAKKKIEQEKKAKRANK